MNCIRGYRAFLADPKRLARTSDPDTVVEESIGVCATRLRSGELLILGYSGVSAADAGREKVSPLYFVC